MSGVAHVHCRDGHLLVEGVSSPFSLMAASDARYGERAQSGHDPRAAVGIARMLAQPGRLFRRAGESAASAPLVETSA